MGHDARSRKKYNCLLRSWLLRKLSDLRSLVIIVYLGVLETLLKDLTSLQYELRKVCVIMKQFWPRALTKNVNELISAKCYVFLSFFNYCSNASFAFDEWIVFRISKPQQNCQWPHPPLKNSRQRVSFTIYQKKKTYTTTLCIKPYEIIIKMWLIFCLITHSVLTIL